MEYPNVKNAHIVPRTYLENWAVGGKVGVSIVPEARRLELPTEKVGTRHTFYRRKRPDGTEIDDIEWTLGQIESAATPLLRSFDDTWPLSRDDKTRLGVLFAFQLLRGPRWKEEYERKTETFVEEWDRENPGTIPPDELEKQNAELRSDTHRLMQMLSTGTTATSVFASMHWTLVEFGTPLIATSDHPVDLWPGAVSRAPGPPLDISQVGIMECLEIRLPLSPTHAVLMTWSDSPDDEEVRVRGNRDHAANLNAFTVAAADRQWFYRPGSRPPVASGNLMPLSPQLVPGYSAMAAATAQRRKRVSEIANSKIGRSLDDQEITVVTMTRRDSP